MTSVQRDSLCLDCNIQLVSLSTCELSHALGSGWIWFNGEQIGLLHRRGSLQAVGKGLVELRDNLLRSLGRSDDCGPCGSLISWVSGLSDGGDVRELLDSL